MQFNELHSFWFLLEQNAILRPRFSNLPVPADTAVAVYDRLLRVWTGSERLPRLLGTAIRGAPKEGVRLSPSSGSRGPDVGHLLLPRGYHHEPYRTVDSPRSNVVLASGLRPSVFFVVPLHFHVPAGFRPLQYGVLPVRLSVAWQQDHGRADHSSVGLIAALCDHPARDTVLRISSI